MDLRILNHITNPRKSHYAFTLASTHFFSYFSAIVLCVSSSRGIARGRPYQLSCRKTNRKFYARWYPSNRPTISTCEHLKIVTALAAKLELGDSFAFRTKLETSSSDAVIYFVGDPTLQTQDLKALLSLAKKMV